MSNITYNHYTRLSDSLERDVMRRALSSGEAVSMSSVLKSAWNSLKKAVVAFSDYVVDISTALNDARAKDARFSNTTW